jgi:hypothetical protein
LRVPYLCPYHFQFGIYYISTDIGWINHFEGEYIYLSSADKIQAKHADSSSASQNIRIFLG